MQPRWTHRVTYKPTGELWYAMTADGHLYHSYERACVPVRGHLLCNTTLDIESLYGGPRYEVVRLAVFRGNK